MFTIAHITDLHIPPLPAMRASELSIKRILGYLSWQRKRKTMHSADILEVLKADIQVHNPDHIMISGDITNLGLDEEYRAGAEWMMGLGGPEKVSAIPGNHDAYRRDPVTPIKRYWTSFTRDDDGAQGFPFVRKFGNVAVIGVSSAVPTWPLMANGRVGEVQLKALRTILHDLGAQKFCRVVMVHHPPQKNATSARRALSNAEEFRAVIKEAGAELVLHGHEHKAVRAEIEGPEGCVPVRGAGSGSCTGKGHSPPAHYHIIEIQDARESWHIDITHRQIDPARRVFTKLDQESLQIPKHSSM